MFMQFRGHTNQIETIPYVTKKGKAGTLYKRVINCELLGSAEPVKVNVFGESEAALAVVPPFKQGQEVAVVVDTLERIMGAIQMRVIDVFPADQDGSDKL